MNSPAESSVQPTVPSFAIPGDAPAAARTALKLLSRLTQGTLTVKLPNGSVQRFGAGNAPMASLHLLNWSPCSAALRSGDIGFAESFIAGDWTTPHLTDLLEVLIVNRQHMEAAIYGNWLGRLAYRVKHLLARNTRANSRKNIHAHYDLGNAFYALWLDGTMNYSCAIFATPDTPMKDAQNAKVRRALNMARVKPGDRVLEIGCGWGALAEMATREFDAHLVGVTLSTEQLDWANQRMLDHGLADKASLRLQDYRDIGRTTADAPFDAICSIEMLEAVGQAFWPEYFQCVARLLKPGGYACIQSIVIADDLFARYLTSTDFIQQPPGKMYC